MYTSGRTVKPARKARPTTVASATADARKLITKYLPSIAGVTVDSARTADPVTLAAQVRTSITFPAGLTDSHVALAMALTDLPGYVRAINDDQSITITRAV